MKLRKLRWKKLGRTPGIKPEVSSGTLEMGLEASLWSVEHFGGSTKFDPKVGYLTGK